MSDLLRLITLSDANTRTVLLGTLLLGAIGGAVGSFAVLRRRALACDTIAHAALPGIVLAFFLIGERNFALFLLGALIFGLLGIGCMVAIRAYTRIKEDAAMAIVLGGFFGLGIVLSHRAQSMGGNKAGLDGFVFGKAASMVNSDVQLVSLVSACCLAVLVVLYKELKVLCFDREFAAVQGWPVLRLDLLLMTLVAVTTVVGLPAVGVVMMAALLIIPAAAARFWTDKLGVMIVAAAIIGAVGGTVGTALSATLPSSGGGPGWATGPLIVLVCAAIFGFSFLFAPRRGVLAAKLRRLRLSRSIGEQNLLRAMFEIAEFAGNPSSAKVRIEDLLRGRSWSDRELRVQLRRAASKQLIEFDGLTANLTPAGVCAAQSVVRAHRLWEFFLVEQASIAPDHVHRDADEVEHVLSPQLVLELERRMEAQARSTPADFGSAPPRAAHAHSDSVSQSNASLDAASIPSSPHNVLPLPGDAARNSAAQGDPRRERPAGGSTP